MPFPGSTTAEFRKIIWPLALAATVALCSGHALPEWARPRLGEDKIEHALVFGLIATLLARLAIVQRTRWIGVYAAALIVSLFGVTDELHQHFTPGRSMDIFDWLADTTGAFLATALYAHWRSYRWLLETPVWALWRWQPASAEVALPVALKPAS